MSQDAKETRPGQATFAGWLIMGASILVVITAWERISGLTTMETRESLESMLAEPPFSGTGMSVGDLTTLIRVACLAAGAAATAAAILGFHVLKRSTSARLALSILAPVLLVGGFATAGFFAPLVVAGIVMLWLYPTREWFAGQPWSQRQTTPRQHGRRVDPDLPDPFTKPEQDAESGPPPGPESSSATEQTRSSAPVAVSNYGAPTAYATRPTTGRRRPAALMWACAMVWSMSGLVSGMLVLLSVVLLVARDEFFTEVERQQPDFDFQGFSQTEITAGVLAMTGVVLVWSAAAVVLAFLALRGANWARVALIASTVAVAVVSLATVFASPPVLVIAASAAATVWLLLRPEVVTWFRDTGG